MNFSIVAAKAVPSVVCFEFLFYLFIFMFPLMKAISSPREKQNRTKQSTFADEFIPPSSSLNATL